MMIKRAEPPPPKGVSVKEWDKKLQAMAGPDKGKPAPIPKRLYHLTPDKNLRRVQRFGLRPRSSRWGEGKRRPHANRVYFTTTPESSAGMLGVLKGEDVNLARKKQGDTYALAVIDPAKVPKMRLKVDPEEPKFSVYGTGRVRPAAITEIRRGRLADLFPQKSGRKGGLVGAGIGAGVGGAIGHGVGGLRGIPVGAAIGGAAGGLIGKRIMEKRGYKLQGHTDFQGLPIAIENRRGSVRKGKSREGVEWRTKMAAFVDESVKIASQVFETKRS